jgi:predicted metal-dependent HD superfamily phosphohydrolase
MKIYLIEIALRIKKVISEGIMTDVLAERWRKLAGSLGAEPQAAEDWFAIVADSYSQYFRHYHGLEHLAGCLVHLDESRPWLANPELVEYALWFHDIVCVPTANSNEELSAAAACYAAARLGLPVNFAEQAAQLILLTRHQGAAGDNDGAFLMDIDLAILGQVWPFSNYEYQIRAEYSHLPAAGYRQGRRQVIDGFLGRTVIYQTGYFREKFEQAARSNLMRLRQQLGSQ